MVQSFGNTSPGGRQMHPMRKCFRDFGIRIQIFDLDKESCRSVYKLPERKSVSKQGRPSIAYSSLGVGPSRMRCFSCDSGDLWAEICPQLQHCDIRDPPQKQKNPIALLCPVLAGSANFAGKAETLQGGRLGGLLGP